jgi:hypothetical protein
MGTETELKFEVAPQDLRKLKAAPALHRKPPKEENLISVYFDTPKHKLARNGVSLRVRHNGDKRLQTVKSEGKATFCFGSIATEIQCPHHVRFDPHNDRTVDIARGRFRAISGLRFFREFVAA